MEETEGRSVSTPPPDLEVCLWEIASYTKPTPKNPRRGKRVFLQKSGGHSPRSKDYAVDTSARRSIHVYICVGVAMSEGKQSYLDGRLEHANIERRKRGSIHEKKRYRRGVPASAANRL